MILLDSDVIIAHLRGVAAARSALTRWAADGPLHTSAVNITEVTAGMRSHERAGVWRLLDSFEVDPVDRAVAVRAGQFARRYRASHHSIGTVDYLVAATADVLGCELKTLNTKHFPMFHGLRPAFELPAAR